jgi:hypothetical protein
VPSDGRHLTDLPRATDGTSGRLRRCSSQANEAGGDRRRAGRQQFSEHRARLQVETVASTTATSRNVETHYTLLQQGTNTR